MINAHIIDSRGVYLRTEAVDELGAQPAGAVYDALPQAQAGRTRMYVGGGWVQVLDAEVPPVPVPPVEPLLARQAAAWERIKNERDRRKYLGVKVGQHWFHSDDSSRIQQLALAMMGNAIPPGLQWKTLTLSPPPVFVNMTPALAQGIFQMTAASDAAIFAAAEAHRQAMEASAEPQDYDITGGWPASIEDAQ